MDINSNEADKKKFVVYAVNDKISMKKPHPCGGKDWKIVRVGADLKLECLTCGRTVVLSRDEVQKRAKLYFPFSKDGEERV